MAETDDIPTAENANTASRTGPWKLIAIVAFLTLVAVILVPGEEKPKPPPLPPAPQTDTPKTLLPKTEDVAAEPSVPEKQTADSSGSADARTQESLPAGPGEAARRLIAELRRQNPPDLARTFAAAREHEANGRLDDAYLLYFFAAREGHPRAALTLARGNDPAYAENTPLFAKPDILQAHKWYLLAEQYGAEGAGEALTALRASVEASAADGDARARRIMLQWK